MRQVVAQRHLAVAALKQPRSLAVEAQDVAHHAPEGGAQQVAPLREQGVERGAVVLEARGVVATEKLISLACDATPSSSSSAHEVRVGAVVEHDEAGVDLEAPAVVFDRCVCVWPPT